MQQCVDFHHVPERQREVHERLEAWALWVRPGHGRTTHPIFRQYRSHAWQWHPPEARIEVDALAAHAVEKAVAALPQKHRFALRWCYCYRNNPLRAARTVATSKQGLLDLVIDARDMLRNRGLLL